MCEIIGYIGSEQAAPILLNGLSKLEYRGYDSAGLFAVLTEDSINFYNVDEEPVTKQSVRIDWDVNAADSEGQGGD